MPRTLALLLMRREFMDLVVGVLELVLFSNVYVRACVSRHEATAAAMQLWDFLGELVRFAVVHAAAANSEYSVSPALGCIYSACSWTDNIVCMCKQRKNQNVSYAI